MKSLFKSTITLAIISLFIYNTIYANENYNIIGEAKLKVLYKLSFQPDSLDSAYVLIEDMILLVEDKTSMYLSYNKYKTISGRGNQPVVINAGGSFIIDGSNFSPAFFDYQIYKNYPEGKITYTDFFPVDYYKYEEPLNAFNWEITDEKKMMGIYSIQKAITNYAGRTWEAWFTPEIPVNEGPYKFNGLPGLILRIQDTKGHFVFEVDDISAPNEQYQILFPNVSFINTDRAKFHSFERAPILNIQIKSDDPNTVQGPWQKSNNFLEYKFD